MAKLPVGRPPHFETPELLWKKFVEYVEKCEEIKPDGMGGTGRSPITITGFCRYAESYRQMLFEYAEKKEFSNTIKHIYNIIENDVEDGLLCSRYNAAGAIFNLKNNWKWKDKQETENVNHNTNQTYEEYRDRLEAERKAAKQEKRTEEEDV